MYDIDVLGLLLRLRSTSRSASNWLWPVWPYDTCLGDGERDRLVDMVDTDVDERDLERFLGPFM